MTTQEYCKKTEYSKKALIWEFNDKQRYKADEIEAINPLIFMLFQMCEVIKVTEKATYDIVKVGCDFNSMFRVCGRG